MFRPYPEEAPWALLAEAGSAAEMLEDSLDLDLVRIAKLEGQIVGAYALRELTPICFELVALAIRADSRSQGCGRWLLGHALGLAESRGGQAVRVRGQRHAGFLARVGFVPDGSDLLLEFTPE
jgi:N-acetylglutamate synthase-like GNAT family acetyltransferase